MDAGKDRRRFPRYVLPSMYTSIAVRPMECEGFQWEGHAYDISEGGMRFEIDEPVAPGTQIAIRIELPGAHSLRIAERRPVYVMANVVWLEEEDLEQAGPVRMACVFKQFVQPGDRERLMARLKSGRYSLAA
jgi:hypothetical protein